MDAVILDGNEKSSLAVTRSLGRRGVEICVGSDSKESLSSSSRFCRHRFIYPLPHRDPEGFLEVLITFLQKAGKPVLFPMTDVTVHEVLRRRSEIEKYSIIPFPDYDHYLMASDKIHLFQVAESIGIPAPRSFLVQGNPDPDGIIQGVSKFGFPLVLKPFRSRIQRDGEWAFTGVKYAYSEEDLRSLIFKEPFSSWPYLIQERIEGPGFGIFLLINKGEVLAYFSHQRIREKPPSGGVSVMCKSIEPPGDSLDMSVRLLRELDWRGVAMVEFKYDRKTDRPRLMEINPRFWGSLQLAVSAGVDFPYLLYLFANGQSIPKQTTYKVGLKCRWELGDLDHLLMRLTKKKASLSLPTDAPSRGRVIFEFCRDWFDASIQKEIFHKEDAKPFLFEMKEYIINVIRKQEQKRFP